MKTNTVIAPGRPARPSVGTQAAAAGRRKPLAAALLFAGLLFGQAAPAVAQGTWVYEAEHLGHAIGRADGGGWSANCGQDNQGHLIYGPYVSTLPAGVKRAQFQLLVDNNSADDLPVVALDVYDATAGRILASQVITRKRFWSTWSWQTFELTFENAAGRALEFRVWWYDVAYIQVDKITIVQPLNGLRGDYYRDFNTLSLVRSDERVDFDWGGGAPDPAVGADNFQVRWTGMVQAQYSETYNFHTVSDDGIMLWVNGQKLIDAWFDQGPTEYSGSISLIAGRKYYVTIDYYERGGGATARLLWSSPSTPKQVVPSNRLFMPGNENQPAAPTSYGWCANENETQYFGQAMDVAYGANGQFHYKYGVTGAIRFANDVFGDPAPGVYKYGYCRIASQAPGIATPPANATVLVGQAATFSVTATGTAPLTYQWRRNGTAIPGATGSSYTTVPTVPGDQGTKFQVVVANAAGSVTSSEATLSVNATGPAGFTWCANENQSLTFSQPVDVAFGVNGQFNYKYNVSGVIVFSTTAFGDPAPGVQKAGYYRLAIQAVKITQQPANATVTVGQVATFSVTATGDAPLTYQWRRNGTPIAGAAGSSYETAPTVTGDHGAKFQVVVTNAAGSVTSSEATLTVNAVNNNDAGLVAHWKLDENSGTSATDASGNGCTGTLVGGANWVAGRVGGAVKLDGTDDFVIVPDRPALRLTTAMTVATWVRADGVSSDWVRLIGKGDNNNRNYGLWRENDGDILFQISSAGASQWANFWVNGGPGSACNIAPGSGWRHVAATYDGTTGKIYLDGVLLCSGTTAITPAATADPVTLGYAGFHAPLNGALDDARIYNRVLNAAEVAALATANATIPVGFTWCANENQSFTFSQPVDVAFGANGLFNYQYGVSGTIVFSVATFGDPAPGVSKAGYYRLKAPSIVTQPANTTVAAGQTATFSVSATGAPLTYQWRRNGATIAGATASSYTTAPTTLSDQGARFQVVVANAAGSVTSGEATLTVTGGGDPVVGNGSGLFGEYWDGPDFNQDNFVLARVDPVLDFAWAGQAPAPAVPANAFSIIWTGYIEAQYSETYTFYFRANGGRSFALTAEDTHVLAWNWSDPAMAEEQGSVALVAGERYWVHIQYANYDNTPDAGVTLSWSSPSTPKQVVPTSQLYLRDDNLAPLINDWRTALDKKYVTLIAGQTVTTDMSVDATDPDGDPLTYSWYQRYGPALAVIAAPHASRTAVTMSVAGQYVFCVDVSDGEYTPNRDTIIVVELDDPTLQAPFISTHPPANTTLREGQAVTFAVTVSSTASAPLTYQWFKNNQAIPGATAATYTIPPATAADHGARFTVTVMNPAGSATSRPAALWIGASGTGLLGEYFVSLDDAGPMRARLDAGVNFDWGTDAPYPTLGGDAFSVRWTGLVEALASETYTFHTYSDGGVRLWVNGTPLVNRWSDGATLVEDRGEVALEAGRKYVIYLEYLESAGQAVAKLCWSSPSMSLKPVPVEHLYPPDGGNAAPVIAAPGPWIQSVFPLPGQPLAIGVTAYDPEGKALTYTWTQTDRAVASFADAQAAHTQVTFTGVGAFNLRVVVSDGQNSVHGDVFGVVNATPTAPKITQNLPANTFVDERQTVTFGVTVTGSEPMTYQWYCNDVAIANATAPNYTTLPLVLPANANDHYYVVVSNAAGSVKSYEAGLSIKDLPNEGIGLMSYYYPNYSVPVFTRIDPEINFEWGYGAPDPAVGADSFSVCWLGHIEAPASEAFTFYTVSDDGIRLWLDDQLLIANWTDHAPTENSATVALTAGSSYNIRIEYYERGGGATAKLLWSSASTPKQIVPQRCLYPTICISGYYSVTASATSVAAGKSLTVSWTAMSNHSPLDRIVLAQVSAPMTAYAWGAYVGEGVAGQLTTTAPTPPGDYEFRYLQEGKDTFYYRSAKVTVTASSGNEPTILSPAWCEPNPATVTEGATLHVVAETPASGELQYAWSQLAGPGAAVFATPEAPDCAVSFSVPGCYLFSVAVAFADGVSNANDVMVLVHESGTGLLANYYPNFTTPSFTRLDPQVNFAWGSAAPDPAVGADNFSVRWTGQVQPLDTALYTFAVIADDGIRLRVNGRWLVDAWYDQGATEYSGTISLTGGRKYDIMIDYYERGGDAVAKLLWSSPLLPKQTIPTSRLFPYQAAGSGDPGLRLWLKLDELVGTSAADASGNNQTGTLCNGPMWSAGKLGGALTFDGDNDYLEVPASPTLKVGENHADFSVAFWVRLDRGPTGQWRSLIHKGGNWDQRTFAMWLHPDSTRVHYRISTSVDWNAGGDSVAELALNGWTHVAYVKSGNRLNLYLNGVLDSFVTLAGTVNANDGALYLGKDPWGDGVQAGFDDLRVYAQALSAAKIAALANLLITTPPRLEYAPWAEPSTVTLPAGTIVRVLASDPDGDPLTYAWTQVSGPGTATFASSRAPASAVTFSAAGVYVLRVTVADDSGGDVTGEVTVTVADPPLARRAGHVDFDGDGLTDLMKLWDDNGVMSADVHLSNGEVFDIARWATGQGGYANAMKWFLGDFDGDGRTELMKLWDDNGEMDADVHLSTGAAFNMQRWATRQGGIADGMQWFVGDFNGDGKTDLMKTWDDNGATNADVHVSTGAAFNMERWATRLGAFDVEMKWFVGDFNGDGRSDLVKLWDEHGEMNAELYYSTGGAFHLGRWATHQGGISSAMKWFVGDFNGDGRADLMKLWDENGEMDADVHLSTGNAFNMVRWATRQGGISSAMEWFVGDFNGDGKTDLMKLWDDFGLMNADVHVSTGSAFSMQRWATQQGGYWDGQKWSVGDFNGDGKTDLIKHWNDNGQMTAETHLSTGSAFNVACWAYRQGGYWEAQRWSTALAVPAPPVITVPASAVPNPVTLPANIRVNVAATDPNGDSLTYLLRQISGPGSMHAGPSLGNEVGFDVAGTYGLRVIVSDGRGANAIGDFTVTVQPTGFANDDDGDGESDSNFGEDGLVAVLYRSQDQAAKVALGKNWASSVQDKREYGGVIYRVNNTDLYGFCIVIGEERGINVEACFIPENSTVVALWHTHPYAYMVPTYIPGALTSWLVWVGAPGPSEGDRDAMRNIDVDYVYTAYRKYGDTVVEDRDGDPLLVDGHKLYCDLHKHAMKGEDGDDFSYTVTISRWRQGQTTPNVLGSKKPESWYAGIDDDAKYIYVDKATGNMYDVDLNDLVIRANLGPVGVGYNFNSGFWSAYLGPVARIDTNDLRVFLIYVGPRRGIFLPMFKGLGVGGSVSYQKQVGVLFRSGYYFDFVSTPSEEWRWQFYFGGGWGMPAGSLGGFNFTGGWAW